MLLIAGGFLLALGLFAGAVLATQARASLMRAISLGASAVLLVFALASVGAIVLGAASLIQPLANTAPLWFVLAVGAVLGCIGAASFGRQPSEA